MSCISYRVKPFAGRDGSLGAVAAPNCFEYFLSRAVLARVLFPRCRLVGRVEASNVPSQTAWSQLRPVRGPRVPAGRWRSPLIIAGGPRLAAARSRLRDDSRLFLLSRVSRGRRPRDRWHAHGSNWPFIAQHRTVRLTQSYDWWRNTI